VYSIRYPLVSSTNKTDRCDITEILLKWALNTKILNLLAQCRCVASTYRWPLSCMPGRTDLSIAKFPIRWFWISTQCASNFYLSIISKHLYTDDSSPWVSPITWNCAIAPRPYSPTEGAKFENIVKILFDIWGLFYFLSNYCYKTCFVCFGRYCNAT
jgi:hypothetical protein